MTTALALLLSAVTAIAQQNLRTAYFLDGYTYKYKMNPALAPERSFISVPVLGNLSLGLESDLGLSNFLYPKGDPTPNQKDLPKVKSIHQVTDVSIAIVWLTDMPYRNCLPSTYFSYKFKNYKIYKIYFLHKL